MRKNPTKFRERFQRWKEGKQVYENGRPLPAYEDGNEPYIRSTIEDAALKAAKASGNYVPDPMNKYPYQKDLHTPLSPVDPVGEFTVGNAVLGTPLKLAGKALMYGVGRYGGKLGLNKLSNWARAKLISGTIDDAIAKGTIPHVDATLTSLGGAHAAKSIANREADWTAALELAPMARLIKPIYNAAIETRNALYNNIYVPYKVSRAINIGVNESPVITAYNRNPATKDLGTLWDYQTYLDGIFPNSKVKRILSHSTSSKPFEEFDPKKIKRGFGFYFSPSEHKLPFSRNVLAKVDIKNPLEVNPSTNRTLSVDGLSRDVNGTKIALKNGGYDGIIGVTNFVNPGEPEIIALRPNQIHILGSNKDLQGFRSFMQDAPSNANVGNITNTIVPQPTNPTKNIVNASIDYSSPDEVDEISRELATKVLMKSAKEQEGFGMSAVGEDKQFSEDVSNIIYNTVLPRMQLMRPGYRGGILFPTVKSKIASAVDRGYTEYPEWLFDRYGKTTQGIHFPETGHIAIRKGQLGFAGPHEIRHRIDDGGLSLTETEDEILHSAYGDDFVNLSKLIDRFKNMNLYKERPTTNLDARTRLLEENGLIDAPLESQNALIDAIGDDRLFDYIASANGYGWEYINYLRNNNLLTAKKADAFRKSMKYVGASAAPLGFYNLYREK